MNRSERRAARKQRGGGGQSDLLASAIRCHEAGALMEAERLYRDVLAADPNNAGVLHNLGILAIQTGRQPLAVDLIGKAVARNRRMPDGHYNLAIALEALGRDDDALAQYRHAIALKPDYADAQMNLGNLLVRRGRMDEALACYRQVLALQPQSTLAYYNIANVLRQGGQLDDAAAHYRQAIALKPDFAEAHNNLGNVLKDGGSTADAEAAYLRALELKPDYAEAHNNLGILLMSCDSPEPAVARYRQALQVRPNFVEAHNNLGLALFALGRPEEAIAHLERAIALKPDYMDAYLNLARQLYAAGDVGQAVAVAARAVAVRATAETQDLFARYVGALPDSAAAEPYRDLVGAALRHGWTRPATLEQVAIGLITRNAGLRPLVTRAGGAAESLAVEPPELAALAGDGLLRDLMISARTSDSVLERVLTAARRELLTLAHAESAPGLLEFACALARHCFINEYIYAQTDEELQALDRLTDGIAARIRAGDDVPALWLAAVAAYRPLHSLAGSDDIASRTWPEPTAGLVAQQVLEPREEEAIRAALPALTAIDDDVSRKVREQYEANPYPRWTAASPAVRTLTADAYLGAKFPRAPLRPLPASGEAEILIAGCGTGRQAIELYGEISGAHILAIDLSAASLAYALRKTCALDLPISYAQADILRLGEIGRSFDLIEASGVLHHLADPLAGWRILLSLLRPGGVMAVGLYSHLARAEINAARSFVAEQGYQATAQDIRRARQAILALPEGAPSGKVRRLGDFYAMSECRDLLFHVQEHQFTIPQIADFLAEQDLQLLGFEVDARVAAAYAQRHPQDPAKLDLARWHDLEVETPDLFTGMYQLAVQKR
jgi:tetratricopeptide (TPR) repeat protein/SAM-dependent methyltransferase